MSPQVEQPVSARRYLLQNLLGREGSKKLIRPIDLSFPCFQPESCIRGFVSHGCFSFQRLPSFPEGTPYHSWRFDRAVAVSDHFYPLGHPSRPTESFSKQARAILYIGPGHFDSIQSFSKQLDLSILGNQPRKEELMNSSSRFA